MDRVNRIGQKKPVHVYQMIAENTVESKVLEIQEKKKQLIQQVDKISFHINFWSSRCTSLGILWYQTD